MQLYLLTFCRITIGVIFAYSFLAKVQNVNRFARTITNFMLLPGQLSKPTAVFILIGELATVVLILMGGPLLPAAFSLAILLLLVFMTALTMVLARSIQTPCHCFGADERLVTAYDLWRNGGLALCAASGWVISRFGDVQPLTWLEGGVIAVSALVFAVLLTHLSEIAALFWMVWEK